MKNLAYVAIIALALGAAHASAPVAAPATLPVTVDWVCQNGEPIGMILNVERPGEWKIRFLSRPCAPGRQS